METTAHQNTGITRLSRFFATDINYILKSGFWFNANFIFTSIVGLTSSILLAHFVSKNAYGTYQFVLAIANTIAVLAPNTMSSAVVRAVAQGNDGDFVQATKFQLRWGIIASLAAITTSLWYVLHNNLELSLALVIVALFMPPTLAFNTWGAYFQGKQDYRRYFLFNSLGTIIAYGGVIVTIFIKPEFFWLALANIFFAFLANFILYLLTVKRMRPGTQTSPDTIPYGTHLSIMGIPQGLVGQLDAILIFHFLGAAPLAIYSFATILPEKLIGGLKFIPIISLPKFSEKNEAEVKGFFRKKIWWLLGFLSLVAGLYALIAPYIFDWLFPAYHASIPYTQLYALSFFTVAASVVNSALVSQKKTKELYITSLMGPIVKAALLLAMLLLFGMWGVIWAQIIAIVLQIILPIYLFHRKTELVSI